MSLETCYFFLNMEILLRFSMTYTGIFVSTKKFWKIIALTRVLRYELQSEKLDLMVNKIGKPQELQP